MKIIFFDSLMPKGHRMINQNYISNMTELGYEVIIAGNKQWDDYGTYKYIGEEWCCPKKGNAGLTRSQSIKNFIRLAIILKKIEFDYLYIASYDICVYWAIFPLLIKHRKKTILQEHNNIDQLDNIIKRSMYCFYKNRIKHFVFEEYFADRLHKLGVQSDLIFIVPHCYGQENGSLNNNNNIVSLSNSNDPNLVDEVIALEQVEHYLLANDVKLVIKSNKDIVCDSSITTLSGWISEADYNRYYSEATYVLLLFPASYSFRVSAVFMEAISRNKYVISSNFALARYYKKKYPGICSVLNSIKEIPLLMKFDFKLYEEDRTRFLRDHSNKKIQEALEEFFENNKYEY